MSFEKYNFPKTKPEDSAKQPLQADSEILANILSKLAEQSSSVPDTKPGSSDPNQHPGENLHPVRNPEKPDNKAPVWEGPKKLGQEKPQKTL